MSTREDVVFLIGSQNREAILRALAIEPRRPAALVGHCGCARETAQQTLVGFRGQGWAKERSGELYHLTPGGAMVHERHERLMETVECADRVSEFLADATDICENAPPGALSQINITTAADSDPHAPLNKYLTVVGSEPVGRFHGVTPIVNRMFSESAEAVLGEDARVELIVDRGVLEHSTDAYPDSFEYARGFDQFELRVTEENLDFGLLAVDGHGLASAYGEHDNLTALVDGDTSEAVSWVEILYESVHSTSVPIDHLESRVGTDNGRDRVGHA